MKKFDPVYGQFCQQWNNWQEDCDMHNLDNIANTFNILNGLDQMEGLVFEDRSFHLANTMLEDIGVNTAT